MNESPLDPSPARAALNTAAATYLFQMYQQRIAANTLSRQAADLRAFATYLVELGLAPTSSAADLADDLLSHPSAWGTLSWSVLQGFVVWQLDQGYAIGSINVRLATIRRYAGLATQAGAIPADEWVRIKLVSSFGKRAGLEQDRNRSENDIATRVGAKKPAPARISDEEAIWLKDQPHTPIGDRDRLMMCILIDHGLRISEVVLIQIDELDVTERIMVVHRPKTAIRQRHRLSLDTYAAFLGYLRHLTHANGALLRTWHEGAFTDQPMSVRGATARVRRIAAAMDRTDLSPHDLRHYWASRAARAGTRLQDLREAGGWASLNMPARYIEEQDIANDRVLLD